MFDWVGERFLLLNFSKCFRKFSLVFQRFSFSDFFNIFSFDATLYIGAVEAILKIGHTMSVCMCVMAVKAPR